MTMKFESANSIGTFEREQGCKLSCETGRELFDWLSAVWKRNVWRRRRWWWWRWLCRSTQSGVRHQQLSARRWVGVDRSAVSRGRRFRSSCSLRCPQKTNSRQVRSIRYVAAARFREKNFILPQKNSG